MNPQHTIGKEWAQVLAGEFSKSYFQQLIKFVEGEYARRTVYPAKADIFKAFSTCDYSQVKVVLLGQDPYHGAGQANGLCFSVRDGQKLPPSLRNIFKELSSDLNQSQTPNGDLSHWARQGVFMLNTTLTVRAGEAGSHQNKGWEQFTDAVIQHLSVKSGLVYILWGSFAQKKAIHLNPNENLILKSPHPSPLSAYRGFFGTKQFSQTNKYLASIGKDAIRW